MIETAVDEKILKPVEKRSIIHEYGEPLKVQVPVYALEEIVAEKLQAILQHVEMLQERGWTRSRARDYYDLWRVLGVYQKQLHLSDFSSFLHAKCAIRNVSFNGPDDFFEKTMLRYVEKTWEQWLGPLIPDLPGFGTVIKDLRPRIALLVS
jgi:predicted nucleotidyltransferase component of viral defense system